MLETLKAHIECNSKWSSLYYAVQLGKMMKMHELQKHEEDAVRGAKSVTSGRGGGESSKIQPDQYPDLAKAVREQLANSSQSISGAYDKVAPLFEVNAGKTIGNHMVRHLHNQEEAVVQRYDEVMAIPGKKAGVAAREVGREFGVTGAQIKKVVANRPPKK